MVIRMKFRSIKSFAIILILCVDFGQNFAQTDLNNHKKYGYYKTRLNNDFIKIGLDPGNSIPVNERAYIQGSPYDFNSKNTQWVMRVPGWAYIYQP